MLEYDQIILIIMSLFAVFSVTLKRSSICILIPISYIPYFINDYSFSGETYYIAEGIRHISVVFSLIFLWLVEGKHNRQGKLYLSYGLLYCSIILLYVMGLFSLLSDDDLNYLSLPLNTLEVVVFMYGFFTANQNNNNNLPSS